jgi:hypothetical protein
MAQAPMRHLTPTCAEPTEGANKGMFNRVERCSLQSLELKKARRGIYKRALQEVPRPDSGQAATVGALAASDGSLGLLGTKPLKTVSRKCMRSNCAHPSFCSHHPAPVEAPVLAFTWLSQRIIAKTTNTGTMVFNRGVRW